MVDIKKLLESIDKRHLVRGEYITVNDIFLALEEQGLTFDSNGNLIKEPLKIEASKWYMCIKDIPIDSKTKCFKQGEMYQCKTEGYLISEQNVNSLLWKPISEYFRPATEEEIAKHNLQDNSFGRMMEVPFDTKKAELIENTITIPEGFTGEIKGNQVVLKSKFKAGDWIVDKTGFVQQVLDYKNGVYTCTYNSFLDGCANNYHLWTIKDAKDGDILVSGQYIIIYEADCPDILYGIYCFCGYNTKTKEFCAKEGDWILPNCHPATKEQCELLFTKIKEAGYEWDAEKKELHKLLTEFDSKLYQILLKFKYKYKDFLIRNDEIIVFAQEHGNELFSIVRKQIVEEAVKWFNENLHMYNTFECVGGGIAFINDFRKTLEKQL